MRGVFVRNGSNLQFKQEGHSEGGFLLDARHIEQEPVAMVRLPRRVPVGLHGSWMPG